MQTTNDTSKLASDLEQRFSEIERRDAVCRNIGVQTLQDISGENEAKFLISLRRKGQECFLYAVGHREQNPKSERPRLCLLGAFPSRDAAKRHVFRHANAYREIGNVFVQDTLVGELVCVSVEGQQNTEEKREKIRERFERYRESLRDKQKRFLEEYQEKREQAGKPATPESNESAVVRPLLTSRHKRQAQKAREQAKKFAGPAKEPEKVVEISDQTQEWGSEPPVLPAEARVSGQEYGIISFLPPDELSAGEPWFRFYSAWPSEEAALKECNRAKSIVHNLNLDVCLLYDEWGELDQDPAPECFQGAGIHYRNSELDNIMKAPAREIERIEEARRALAAIDVELPEIEVPDDEPSTIQSLQEAEEKANVQKATFTGIDMENPEDRKEFWNDIEKEFREQIANNHRPE